MKVELKMVTLQRSLFNADEIAQRVDEGGQEEWGRNADTATLSES